MFLSSLFYNGEIIKQNPEELNTKNLAFMTFIIEEKSINNVESFVDFFGNGKKL